MQETADAMLRALRASSELQVGDVSVVPNKRGPGVRVYVELLLREAAAADQPVTSSARAARVRGGRTALPPAAPRR
ncbi:hypothetical protein BOQ63_001455 (plasmid) [Streptomyces viridifaciens]|nr:hypothetical protein BOQ63_001455 [Streptomyces viridifaciens]